MNKRYRQAKKTTLERHGDDFYKNLAQKGGSKSKSWWNGDSEKASELARKRWDKYREDKANEEKQSNK